MNRTGSLKLSRRRWAFSSSSTCRNLEEGEGVTPGPGLKPPSRGRHKASGWSPSLQPRSAEHCAALLSADMFSWGRTQPLPVRPVKAWTLCSSGLMTCGRVSDLEPLFIRNNTSSSSRYILFFFWYSCALRAAAPLCCHTAVITTSIS